MIEYHERLRRMERVLLAGAVNDRSVIAPTLLRMASTNGAASLQLQAGAIEAGCAADLISINLQNIAISGWNPETLDATIALSAPASIICDVWVAGRQVIAERHHKAASDIALRYAKVAERIT